MDLSVIIVNYNVKYFLEHCLCSVLKAAAPLQCQIIVVDNNSNDGSKEYFSNKFSNVQFIYNTENVGFAKANNAALPLCTGKYILFLNPDTIIPEDCFTKCFAFMEENTSCGALGVPMIDGAGNYLKESKRAFPSPLTSFYKLSGLARLFPKSEKFAKYHLGHLDKNSNHEVDVLAGAFLLTRKSIIDKIGGFDEQFFMYGEDVDFSYRIQKANYKNYYFAGTTIIHFKGESTKRGSLNYIKMFYKAMSQFVLKHYGTTKAKTFNVFIQFAIAARGVMSVIKQFVKLIGLPIMDAAIILFSVWQVKLFWFAYIKKDVKYIREIVVTSALIYTILYITVGVLSGLYDKPYKQRQTNRTAFLCTLFLLSFYALLPEQYRYSRGITALSAVVVFVAITIFRWLLIKVGIIEKDTTTDEEKQTIVVSNNSDYVIIEKLYTNANMQNRLLGKVDTETNNGIANYNNLQAFSNTVPFKNIVFSSNSLTYKAIINQLQFYKKHLLKFYSDGASSIISSDGQKAIGESITQEGFYKIDKPNARRSKKIVDISASLILLIFSPFLFLFIKNKENYVGNLWQVLIGKKTMVGYITNNNLPAILPCIINIAANNKTDLSQTFLTELDIRYAKKYHYSTDIKTIVKYYFN